MLPYPKNETLGVCPKCGMGTLDHPTYMQGNHWMDDCLIWSCYVCGYKKMSAPKDRQQDEDVV